MTSIPNTSSAVIEPWAAVWNGGNLRAAPSFVAAVIATVRAGDQVKLAGWAGEWWWVHTSNGTGWLNQSLLIVDPEAIGHVPFIAHLAPDQAGAQIVNGDNLRQSPDRNSDIVAGVDAGDVLQVVGRAGEWWQVRTAASTSWIHSSLVQLDPQGAQTIPTQALASARTSAPPAVTSSSNVAAFALSTPCPSDPTLRLAPRPWHQAGQPMPVLVILSVW